MKTIDKKRWIGIGFVGFVFLFFLVFFAKIYPIVISTTDDYFAFVNHRHILPEWHGSNPIRVFAEVFMPLVSQGSSLLFRVFGGSILDWLTFGWAFCVASVLAGLVVALYQLFRKAGVSTLFTCAGLLIFLLMHFWIFKQKGQDGNIYMLHTVYACTYFYYVIPNLLNAILVLWIHTDQDLHKLFMPEKLLKKALFVFLVYISIYSNIWAGAILASYLGVQLVISIISSIRKKEGFGKWLHKHYVIVLLIAVWLSSQFFEMNGLRAAAVELKAENFHIIWNAAINYIHYVNIRYAIFCTLVIVGGLILLVFRKDRKVLAEIGILALSLVLFIAYYILSCFKTGTYYVTRPDVFYGAFFYGAVIVLYCFFEVLKRIPVGKLILPLLILFILVDCNSMGRTYKDSVSSGRKETYATHNSINQDILEQLKEAEANGLKETRIYVPDYDNVDNWPYATYAGEQISKGFYKLGALNEEIRITEIVPSKDKNSEHGIGEP